MILLAADLEVHMTTAQDHIHPDLQRRRDARWRSRTCAMLSENKRSMNICVVPLPPSWLKRTYTDKIE